MKTILVATLLVGSALAQTRTISVTPLKATFVRSFSETRPDGSTSTGVTTGTYYRDASGRTRLELGNTVRISDPVARTTVVLDLAAATARVLGTPVSPSAAPNAEAASSPTAVAPVHSSQAFGTAEPVRRLGAMYINDFLASGFRGEAIFPAGVGRPVPTRHVSEMWRADELRLPIKTTNTESAVKPGGDEVIRQSAEEYRDIVQGAAIDPALFQIPAAFKVTNAAANAASPAP